MEQQQIKQKYYRKEIFENDMSYPKDLINISYSKHCLERLEERLEGSLKFLPTVVRITEKNISSGHSIDGKKLDEVLIRINYKADTWCFLAINLESYKVKTVYFKKK
jgi:hypothetical protein